MSILFYIGIAIVFLTFIPWLTMSGKMMRAMKKYENLPIKLNEIKATYRQKRFRLLLIQLFGIAGAILGAIL